MTTDLEQRLHVAFREDAQRARLVNPEGPVAADERPPAPHRRSHTAGWLVAAAVLIVAGVVGVVLIQDGGEDDREVTTAPGRTPRNGPVVTGNGESWPPGEEAPAWDRFDTRSGLLMNVGSGAIRVFDADGEERADIHCRLSFCGQRVVFGPGVDEVTRVAVDDAFGWADPDGLEVTAWDGTVRDTLGIAAAFTEDDRGVLEQELADLAWSPDGTRLAVATVPKYECDPLLDPCASHVWTFDRHGGEPQLVYSTPGEGPIGPRRWVPTEIWDLAWAPDGHSVGLVAVPAVYLGDPTWPRLDVVRFQPDGTVRTDTLHDYRRARPADSLLVQSDKGETFAFAWSPDGTRIAVAGEDGLEEISAVDGQVLARHPGVGVDDEGHSHDLAWLPAT